VKRFVTVLACAVMLIGLGVSDGSARGGGRSGGSSGGSSTGSNHVGGYTVALLARRETRLLERLGMREGQRPPTTQRVRPELEIAMGD